MLSRNTILALLPLFANANAWIIQFSHEANCAAEDENIGDPISGAPGVTFPEQTLMPDYVHSEGIEPVQWQSFTVEGWDDNCVIEFYYQSVVSPDEVEYVMDKLDRHVHEFGENRVCVYDVPGNVVTGDSTWLRFRYLCE